MANRMERGAAWKAAKQAALCAATVTYARGSSSHSIKGQRTLSQFQSDQGPVQLFVSIQAYTIAVDDFEATTLNEPKRGDRITDTINGTVHVFEVMPQANERAFSTDAHRTAFKVLCKRIA